MSINIRHNVSSAISDNIIRKDDVSRKDRRSIMTIFCLFLPLLFGLQNDYREDFIKIILTRKKAFKIRKTLCNMRTCARCYIFSQFRNSLKKGDAIFRKYFRNISLQFMMFKSPIKGDEGMQNDFEFQKLLSFGLCQGLKKYINSKLYMKILFLFINYYYLKQI